MILIGHQLGTYEILSLLGAGGMGEVYRARDTKLNRDVALKILPDAFARDADRLARFRREAQAVAALNHPHIVTIFSIEEHEAVPFMTMELVEGSTLEQVIPGGGLAPALGTRVGIVVGTMPYMSPEQIEAKLLDHRTDLFSLGIMLFELVTGERPFRGDSPAALMSSILKDHPRPVAERRPDISTGVSRLIDRCLEKEPRDRVHTATEIHAELKACRRAWETGGDQFVRPAAPHRTERPVEREASIAVLAFADMSAAKDQDWFCDGIAEEILNAPCS